MDMQYACIRGGGGGGKSNPNPSWEGFYHEFRKKTSVLGVWGRLKYNHKHWEDDHMEQAHAGVKWSHYLIILRAL